MKYIAIGLLCIGLVLLAGSAAPEVRQAWLVLLGFGAACCYLGLLNSFEAFKREVVRALRETGRPPA